MLPSLDRIGIGLFLRSLQPGASKQGWKGSHDFRNHAVVITGASAGIGQAIALRLAEQGARVALAARRADRLAEVAAECRMRGGEAIVVPTDVRDEAQCRSLISRAVGEFGRLDVLVNNAGIAVGARIDSLPDLGLFKQVMDVNFYGQVYCTYHALPHLTMTKGRILAISSLGGKAPIPYNTPYVASKFGLHGFYDTLRLDLAGTGVSVTVVCPYWVVTEFHERQMDKDGNPRGPLGRSVYTRNMMTAARCAEISLKAAAHRRREVLMWPGPLLPWLRALAPGLLDWLTLKLFLEPAVRRVQEARQPRIGGA